MFAFIKHSGKQYKVSEGSTILVDKLTAEKGAEFIIDSISLFVSKDNALSLNPKGNVTCQVLGEVRSKKVLVFKQRPKKGYRRKKGHRQTMTRLLVKSIAV
jgi:large subunit ribosomal protein L21